MTGRKGFTLAELLVVILAISVLLVLFVHIRGVQEKARRAQCMSNLRQIGLAMIQHAGDHDGDFMPVVDETGTELPTAGAKPTQPARSGYALLIRKGYLITHRVFVCPSSTDTIDEDFLQEYRGDPLEVLILDENHCSYGWDPTKRHSPDAPCAILADKPSPDVSEANEGTARNNSDNHRRKGQNVFYTDGHVKWTTTPAADIGDDPDIYTGGPAYEKSTTDAKIIR